MLQYIIVKHLIVQFRYNLEATRTTWFLKTRSENPDLAMLSFQRYPLCLYFYLWYSLWPLNLPFGWAIFWQTTKVYLRWSRIHRNLASSYPLPPVILCIIGWPCSSCYLWGAELTGELYGWVDFHNTPRPYQSFKLHLACRMLWWFCRYRRGIGRWSSPPAWWPGNRTIFHRDPL
jgi:hypothetical protein